MNSSYWICRWKLISKHMHCSIFIWVTVNWLHNTPINGLHENMPYLHRILYSVVWSWMQSPRSCYPLITVLVQIMAWRRSGAKPLSEPMIPNWPCKRVTISPPPGAAQSPVNKRIAPPESWNKRHKPNRMRNHLKFFDRQVWKIVLKVEKTQLLSWHTHSMVKHYKMSNEHAINIFWPTPHLHVTCLIKTRL